MIDLTIESLSYLEIKRALEATKEAIAQEGHQLQINMIVLEKLESEILKYPEPSEPPKPGKPSEPPKPDEPPKPQTE